MRAVLRELKLWVAVVVGGRMVMGRMTAKDNTV